MDRTREFHLHLVSDATGETLNAVAKAASAQFENVELQEHFYALVRSERQLERVIAHIREQPGLVFFTLVNPELRRVLEAECARLVPLGAVHVRTLYDGNDSCIPMLDIEGNEFCID